MKQHFSACTFHSGSGGRDANTSCGSRGVVYYSSSVCGRDADSSCGSRGVGYCSSSVGGGDADSGRTRSEAGMVFSSFHRSESLRKYVVL